MNSSLKEIHNIQWLFPVEFDEAVLNGVNTNIIFGHIKRIDKLPIVSGDIYFSSDIWDFNSVTLKRVPKRKSEFNFSNLNFDSKDHVKFFTLSEIWKDVDKVQTIYVTVSNIKDFIQYLASNGIYSLDYVSLQTVKNYFQVKETLTAGTIQRYKLNLIKYFQFYSSNFTPIEWLDIHKYLSNTDSHALEAQRQANKWDTIPEQYFDNLIACLTKVMDDTKSPIDDRGIAAMVILLSQTGLRNGELCDCTVGSLGSMEILNGTKTAHFLRYKTSKGVKGNGNFKEVYTIMTELACRAYSTLETIYRTSRIKANSNLLYVPLRARTLPVSENTLTRMTTAIALKYGKEIGCINVDAQYSTLYHQNIGVLIERKVISNEYLSMYMPTDTLSIPRPHQYRVKLCNELINQGVSLLYVQRHMNHLEKEITLGYQRIERDLEKEKEFAESVMKMLVTGESEIMGEGKDTLMLRINEHLESSNLNIANDVDEIVRDLTKKVPIRAKEGGICIKSGPIRECGKSDATDELFCAYGMCNNLFHSFFMIDINYQKYTTLLKTIKYNQEKGFKKASEKETNKLRWIVETYLIPELVELQKEVQRKGEIEIKKKFPQVSYFVDNYDSINKEVRSWIN
jgi:site-specific recombinase XerD